MTFQDQEYPWLFHRDDIDLLEDELEDLYETYLAPDPLPVSLEATVLKEQMDTEDASDTELSLRLGAMAFAEPPPSAAPSQEPLAETFSTPQKESSIVRSHPLYQQARAWNVLVKPLVKRGHEQGGPYQEGYFRVYANLNMVPLKIYGALLQEGYDDPTGLEVAHEEYVLALTYLDRILYSLSTVTFTVEDMDWVEQSQQKAQRLRTALVQHLNEVDRRKAAL